MESNWPLDYARRPGGPGTLRCLLRWSIAGAFLYCSLALHAQSASSPLPSERELQQLAAAQRWNDLVLVVKPVMRRSAAMDLYLGIALAQLGRLPEAQNVLESGRRLNPADPRFSVELAGAAFKEQKNYPLTIRDCGRRFASIQRTPTPTIF